MEENKKPENPNAFPDPMRGAEQSFTNQTPQNHCQGMTLRDYFAAKAMQALIAHFGFKYERNSDCHSEKSYQVADAMLTQRNKEQDQ